MPRIRTIKPGVGMLAPASVSTRFMSYDELRPGEALVYRFLDASWNCIYVGVTCSPLTRWRAHLNGKAWSDEIAAIYYVAGLPVRRAWDIERDAIRSERPKYNRTVKP